MNVTFAEKAIFFSKQAQTDRFPPRVGLIWGMFINHFIAIARYVSAPFLSFYSALLFSLPFAFHVLSSCRKTLAVIMGKA